MYNNSIELRPMVFHKHLPTAPLAHFVDCILYVEGNNKGVGLPKTVMSLVFNLHDPFKLFTEHTFSNYTDYKKYWVAGLQTQPTYVESYGQSKMVVVQFKTLGAYAFLGQPLHHFVNSYVTLDHLFQSEADETWEQLQESETIREKMLRVENFLYRRILTTKMPKEKLLSPIGLLINNDESTSVNEICRRHHISRKHLNSLFQEYIGLSPKMFSSLNRFQSILLAISTARPDKLADVAYGLNFFDQAHFSNNFKRFTGITPNQYMRHAERTPSLKVMPHFVPAT